MADLKTSLQIPEDFLERAKVLAERLATVGDFQALGKMTKSKVLRLAIARGLVQLEAEYGGKRKRRK